MNFEKYVNNTFDMLGIPCNILGRQYLFEAVKVCHENPTIRVCKLYAEVAEKVGATASRVERAMRFAIHRGLDNCTPSQLEAVFGNTISALKGYPTNAEFIFRVNHMYGRMEGSKS